MEGLEAPKLAEWYFLLAYHSKVHWTNCMISSVQPQLISKSKSSAI
jgi:hypothetical protein